MGHFSKPPKIAKYLHKKVTSSQQDPEPLTFLKGCEAPNLQAILSRAYLWHNHCSNLTWNLPQNSKNLQHCCFYGGVLLVLLQKRQPESAKSNSSQFCINKVSISYSASNLKNPFQKPKIDNFEGLILSNQI